MKILFVTDSFNYCCGRTRHIVTLATYLHKRGFSISILCGGGDGESLLDGLNIRFIKSKYILHRNRSYFMFVCGIMKILILQYKFRFNIIHAHHHYASILSRPATLLFKIPHIMTVHGAVKRQGLLPFYTGDYFIAVSNATKSFAINNKRSLLNKIEAIQNGIDIERTPTAISWIQDIHTMHNIESNELIISMIGRIVKHKGHEVLFKSLNQLDVTKNICCIIVGGGEYLEYLKNISSAYNVKIIFTDVVQDPTNYYCKSDIIVIPSLCCEGLPMTLLEAGKYSKPVIASQIEGIVDVIVHRKNGYLVEPNNISALKNALSILIESKELRENYGYELNKTVRDSFSAHSMTDKTMSVYDRLSSKSMV